MEKLKQMLITVARFTGITLLVDVVLVLGVGVSCLIGDSCTAIVWSERMFWIGLALMMIAGPLAIGYLSSGRLRPRGFVAEGWEPIGTRERLSAEERQENIARVGLWALRIVSVGLFSIIIGILIEVFSR
jgi:putative heme iron utilization protein